MGSILTFPDRCDKASEPEFLQDGDDILTFHSASSENPGHEYAFPLPKNTAALKFQTRRTKDWSNQELAHLFRVKRLLDLAGVANSIDRGLTDEGDPWFLFCDAGDEVFIHLCRINGVYILDNPGLQTPLRGNDFSDLIEAFMQRKMRGTSETPVSGSHKIVRLERNRNLFLHPSTMLAALVWTLFLESDDLVMVMPADHDSTPETSNDQGNRSDITDSNDMIDPLTLILTDHEVSSGKSILSGSQSHNARSTEDSSESKFGHHTYAIGLSAVAISYGLMSETHFSDIDITALQNILAMFSGQDDISEKGSDVLEAFGFYPNGAQELVTDLTQFFADVSLMIRNKESLTAADAGGAVDKPLIDNIKAFLETVAVASQKSDGDVFSQDVLPPQDQSLIETPTSTASNSGTIQDGSAQAVMATVWKIDKMLSEFGSLNISELFDDEFVFNNGTVFATFDMTVGNMEKTNDLVTVSLGLGLSENGLIDISLEDTPASGNQMQKYGDAAYEFISFLMAKEGDLEVLATAGEVILFDPRVFDVSVNETFTRSWTLDNGEIISTIGLRSDFEAYDLIA